MKKTNDGSHIALSSRTSRIIGRQDILRGINKAISNKSTKSHILYLEGPGGMGKTRLLEEIANIQKQWKGNKFLWSGIIDLYYEENHSPDNLQKAIVEGLDKNNKHFIKFQKLQKELEEKQRQGFSGPALEKLRQDVNEQFLEEYNTLARKQRLVLCFDTVELIQYESDIIQQICQVEDEATIVKNWLINHITQFSNTVIIFAGRSQPKVEKDFEKAFSELNYKIFHLARLTAEESHAYLDAMIERNPELSTMLTSDARKWVIDVADGRPIRLTLCVNLLVQGEGSLPQIDDIDSYLVYKLYLSPESDEIFRYLIIARKGLDKNLLRYLTKWSGKKIQDCFTKIQNLEIVKTRAGSNLFFLHDEIYDLVDQYYKDDPRFGREHYSQIAEYYEEKLKTAKPSQRQDLAVALLYYKFQVDASIGYYNYYARLDEEAINGHEPGFDMRLRDEGLRFMDRYANPSSRFYSPRVATEIDRPSIDRDCAVRWVKRNMARGAFTKAQQIAENVRNNTDPIFNWETVRDPLYKARFLVSWAQAGILASEPELNVSERLSEALKHLTSDQQFSDDQNWWKDRILGSAYNLLGYFHRLHGRYDLAREYYKRALPFFEQNERAGVLNNLAYLLAVQGNISAAWTHANQALSIRRESGRKYPIALSLNTRGIIRVLDDHPMWGERDCKEALRICEDLDDQRGMGLAHIGLGLALRKRADQWKLGVYQPKEAERFFETASEHLEKAIRIFTEVIFEPIRIWEAYNELGSVYCDWGWLCRRQKLLYQRALIQYDLSILYQQKALQVAQEHKLSFQAIDSYDDLAQVYADRSFLLFDMSKPEDARQDLITASSYLDKVTNIIPAEFHIVIGKGFVPVAEPGKAYLLSQGKVHLQRGIWIFEQIKREQLSESKKATLLIEGIRHFALATAYFYRYWPKSHAFDQGLNSCAVRLQHAGVSANLARTVVQETADMYQINLEALLETIDNVLGL